VTIVQAHARGVRHRALRNGAKRVLCGGCKSAESTGGLAEDVLTEAHKGGVDAAVLAVADDGVHLGGLCVYVCVDACVRVCVC